MTKKWFKAVLACAAALSTLSAFAVYAAPAAALTAAPAVQAFGPDGMARIVASQKGEPFVLLVWSLDCVYCQASMKTLGQERTKRALKVVTLATDAVDDAQSLALIRKKLRAARLTDNAWAFGGAPAEQLRYAVDPKWHGEMPRSYWFDARGERIAYSGVITTEVINKMAPRD
jgi:hypothetical protein